MRSGGSFDGLWSALEPIGRQLRTGGYRRYAWTPADAELREWFAGEARARGLDLTEDRAGNLWAWWGDPDAAPGRAVVTGSHLDSVPDGGAFDGPLGVVSALAAVDALRAEGFRPDRPIGVAVFADEEGARFGVACAGSRILTGVLDPDRARGLTDRDGVSLAEALSTAGRDPGSLGPDPEALARIGTFVELHVEQGRALADGGPAVAVGREIWPHGRWRIEVPGEANHAGTTRLEDRRDAMIGCARLVLAARVAAQAHGCLATIGKVVVEPGGVNAIPGAATAWLDARGADEEAVRALVRDVAAEGSAVGATVDEESWTGPTRFSPTLAARMSKVLDGAPLLGTGAGHDAGILAAAGVPTAMLFVRNPSGVSHAPEEWADPEDCRAGVAALTTVLADLAGGADVTSYWVEHAVLPDGLAERVRVSVDGDRIGRVVPGVDPDPSDERLAGVLLPGLANAHTHAFHRVLRGRTHHDGGTFWTWREQMYAAAARLHPDRYRALARAVYLEMVLAGYTVVGEFHYLHHAPGGRSYDDPNAMSYALIEAAEEVGLRLTLLDTCYLAGGLTGAGHTPLDPVQQRFSDGSVERWAARRAGVRETERLRLGAAAHSVRTVPEPALAELAAGTVGGPRHVHLSEQPAENAACLAHYGATPTELLHRTGFLGAETTAVHATHLTRRDVERLGGSHTGACFCPTTERDLADGIGPARTLLDAGSPLSLGSDSQAVVDPFEELRGLEAHERLQSGARGRFAPVELIRAASADGYRSLGWDGGGRVATGAIADFVVVRDDSARTAGCRPDQLWYAAIGADVDRVVVGGRPVVVDGRHRLGAPGRLLRQASQDLW